MPFGSAGVGCRDQRGQLWIDASNVVLLTHKLLSSSQSVSFYNDEEVFTGGILWHHTRYDMAAISVDTECWDILVFVEMFWVFWYNIY